jgi:hypothetical protein
VRTCEVVMLCYAGLEYPGCGVDRRDEILDEVCHGVWYLDMAHHDGILGQENWHITAWRTSYGIQCPLLISKRHEYHQACQRCSTGLPCYTLFLSAFSPIYFFTLHLHLRLLGYTHHTPEARDVEGLPLRRHHDLAQAGQAVLE